MSAINAAVVYCRFCKAGRPEKADSFLSDLNHNTFPVTVFSASDRRVYSAVRLKGRYLISLADAFAAGLATEFDAPVVSGDPEFRRLVENNEIQVEWLE